LLSVWTSPFSKKSTSLHRSLYQKTVSISLPAEGTVFGFWHPCSRHLHTHQAVARRWLLPSFRPSQEIQWHRINETTYR
jgi:hypothetical protein